MNSDSAPVMNLPRLEFIDSLKGIAILMVVFFHTSLNVGEQNQFWELREKLEHLSRGVQLFFIISAFTLCRASIFRAKRDKRPVASFYVRRFFRIMPLWWLAIIIYSLFMRNGHTYNDIFATAFMYFGFYKKAFYISLLPVGWSLFVEETFYWVFPFLRMMINGLGTSLLFCILGFLITRMWFDYALVEYDSIFASIFPLGNLYAFFVGFSLYYIYEYLSKNAYDDFAYKKIFWLDIAGAIGIYQIFHNHKIIGTYCLVPFILSSFFKKSLFGRIMSNEILQKFGKYCYSIYLFHSLIIFSLGLMQHRIVQFSPSTDWQFLLMTFTSFVLAGLASFFVGGWMFYFFETPSIKLGKNIITKFDL